MNHGLTILVGPSGSGKTSVMTQIISNLYHNDPNQRILIIGDNVDSLKEVMKTLVQVY